MKFWKKSFEKICDLPVAIVILWETSNDIQDCTWTRIRSSSCVAVHLFCFCRRRHWSAHYGMRTTNLTCLVRQNIWRMVHWNCVLNTQGQISYFELLQHGKKYSPLQESLLAVSGLASRRVTFRITLYCTTFTWTIADLKIFSLFQVA